jgi:hypothetical protein
MNRGPRIRCARMPSAWLAIPHSATGSSTPTDAGGPTGWFTARGGAALRLDAPVEKLRRMQTRATFVSLACGLGACFSPERQVSADTETSADTTMGDDVTETAAMTMSASGPSTSEPTTGMTTSPDSTVSMTTDPDTTTGQTELGPQIVMSLPADGDLVAGLDGYFLLHFDRVVSTADAVGHIFVSQNGSEAQPISPMPCPPDADPTCIAGVFPMEFVDPASGRLPGGTPHTVTVEAAFPDPDGMVNTMDQVVAFTTFEYESNFYDDSAVLSEEFGGIAYDEGSESLFLVGSDGDACRVRRIPIPGGVPGSASTAANPTGAYLCYGMDAIAGQLFVSGSYTDNVFRYSNLGDANLDPSEVVFANPPLPPPLADLSEVWSVARGGGSTFFSHGEFTGGTEDTSILRLSDVGEWSEFESGENLWDNADGVVIEGADIGGTEYLVVAAAETIFKFRIADGALISQSDPGLVDYAPDLHVDSAGRLWIGTGAGVRVLDIEDDSYDVIDQRLGFRANRIALREDGSTVNVYFVDYRGQGIVGHVAIDL